MLKGFYGGKAKSGKKFMTPEDGIDLKLIEEDEFESFSQNLCQEFPNWTTK